MSQDVTVDWTRTDDSPDGDWLVELATDSGFTTIVATATEPPGTTIHTFTGMLDGEQYYGRVTRRTDHATTTGGTDSTVTTLPAPTFDALTVVNGDELDFAWTDNSDNEDGFRVLLSRDGGATWSQENGDLAAGTTTYTTGQKLDGEQYHAKVEVFTEHTASESGVLDATTALPDVAGLMLDSTVKDELTATWTDTQDYGNYRVEIKESDEATWTDTRTPGHGDTAETFPNLKDGEQYDVRLRGSTEHATTAWLEVSKITALPAPTNFVATEPGPVPANAPSTMTWTDVPDNPEGEYAILVDDGSGFAEVEVLGPDATTTDYAAPDAAANTPHTAKARFRTQYVFADTNTDSWTSALAGAEGAWIAFSRGTGDYRQLDATISSLNPVREHTAISDWEATVAYDVSLEDWVFAETWLYDGAELLFRGELLDIDSDTGRARTTLAGDDELVVLDRTDAAVSYTNELAWKTIQNFIDTETVFTSDVTEPSASSTTEQLVDYDTGTDLAAAAELDPTDPVIIDDDGDSNYEGMFLAQTGWILEGETGTTSWSTVTDSSIYSGDQAVDTGSDPAIGSEVSWSWHTDYEIGGDDLDIRVHLQIPGSEHPEFTVTINGTDVGQIFVGQLAGGESSPDYATINADASALGQLPAGDHTVTLELTNDGQDNPSGDRMIVDCLSIVDTSYIAADWTAWEGVTNGVIDGPPLYPDGGVQVWFENTFGTWNLESVDFTSEWGAATNAEFGVSFDDGASFVGDSGSKTSTLTNTAGPTTSVKPQIVLNRRDTGDANSPSFGDGTARLFRFDVVGNGNTRGVIDDDSFTGSQLEVLQQLLDRGGMRCVLEYEETGTSTIAAFRAGDVVEPADWVLRDGGESRSVSGRGYANRVIVRGKKDANGDRPKIALQDDAEIAALAIRLGVSDAEATFERPVKKPDISDIEELKSIARTTLDSLVDEDSLTGSLDVAPVMIDPGKSYAVPEWGGVERALERVSYSLGRDGLSGTLDFQRPTGIGVDIDSVAAREQETRDAI